MKNKILLTLLLAASIGLGIASYKSYDKYNISKSLAENAVKTKNAAAENTIKLKEAGIKTQQKLIDECFAKIDVYIKGIVTSPKTVKPVCDLGVRD